MAEYGLVGWSAFTLDGVARRAGIGKAALYRRWPTKEQLLADAIAQLMQPSAPCDTDSLADDARALAATLLSHFLDPAGWVTMRVAMDATVGLETFAPFQEQIIAAHREHVRGMMQRAVSRGELPPGTQISPFAEALYGSVVMYALSIKAHEREHVRGHVHEYASPLADFVLAALPVRPVENC
ncbi:TetR/AcrR family transcriptional regulator [Streptomyces sp. NPDC096311]|uniref:TetR/AcrR family transcriptional regulator n=1 Tax=Streptomyces sp. NPDC096311 TaxID=3366083 RepID=UPI00380774B3